MTRAAFSDGGGGDDDDDDDVVVFSGGGGGGRVVRLDSKSSGEEGGSESAWMSMRMGMREREREKVRVLGDGMVGFVFGGKGHGVEFFARNFDSERESFFSVCVCVWDARPNQ